MVQEEVSLEKSGLITLTDNDIAEFLSGNVSERVKETWNISFTELSEVIRNNQYTKL